jgi:hypothetical protein
MACPNWPAVTGCSPSQSKHGRPVVVSKPGRPVRTGVRRSQERLNQGPHRHGRVAAQARGRAVIGERIARVAYEETVRGQGAQQPPGINRIKVSGRGDVLRA